MSLAAITCPRCGQSQLNTAKFCGGCGAPVAGVGDAVNAASAQPTPGTPFARGSVGPLPPGGSAVTFGQSAFSPTTVGLILGVVSVLMCGVFASIPGIYFSWKGWQLSRAQGLDKTWPGVAMGLNILGIILTLVAIVIVIFVFVLSATAGPDPFNSFTPEQPWGY